MLAADQAAAVAGNIAFIDRGTCGFTIKVKNAQDAGAVAAIVASTATGAFGTMGGTDPTITIPSVIVPFAEGNLLRDNLTGLNVTLFSGADTMASFSSRGPRLSASPIQLKPDVAAPGFAITSAQTGMTCTAGNCIVPNASGFLAGSQPLVLNGTSMAAPHVAGIMALLRQRHPDWTVEELKALVMNTSLHDVTSFPGGNGDRFGPGRLGAGRVDTNLAARSDVVAFNTDDDGLVSLAFDGRVFGNVTRTRKVRVVNHGTTPQHYDLAIDTVVDAPGVSYLVGLNSVTVPAGSSVEVDVTMTADASQMDHARDATVATTQAAPVPLAGVLGALSRHWLTEEAGYLTFNQSGATQLRVPIHAVAMPHSNMSAGPTITTGGATTGSTTIPLSGTELCTGTLTAGPTCEGTFPTDIASLVSPFELQVVSPADPVSAPPFADIQYVGVAHIAATNQYLFGVSTWAPWGSPSQVAFNIYIDSNNDGTWDSILFNSNPGTMAANLFGSTPASPQDTFIAGRLSIPASTVSISSANNLVNLLPAAAIESRVFDNQVLVLAAPAPQLNITGAFRYKVMTCPGSAPLCQQLNGFHFDEAAGPYSWNASAQGLDFNGARLLQDLNGGSIPLTWNLANMTANGSLGALLLHHHNQPGSRAEVVLLEGAAQTDLGITFSASPTAPAVGQTTTLTATVTNHGSTAATGIQVLLDLPPALTFVSAGGGGTFHDGDGTWSIPSVPAAGSVSLKAIYTAEAAGSLAASATITASTPLDPNPENNHAVLGLNPPSSADVQVTASASGAPVAPGGSASYALEVRNNGNETAYNVVVSTTFVAGVGTIAGGTPSHGVFTAGTGQWRIASLGRGAAATVTLAATATSGPLLTLSANAASLVTDPAPTNNIATASVAVTPRPTTLTLTLDPATVHVGSGSVATVTVLDAAAGSTPPAGTVGFVSTDNSDGLSALSCTLAPVPATTDRSSCQVIVTPGTVGPRTVTASYVANGIHGTSISTATLTATLRPTTLTLTLDPATVHAGSGSVATVTVLDAAAGASHPVGTVGFLSTGSSDTLSAPSCTLAPVVATTDRSSCQVTVTPGAAGPRTVTASYVANGIHDTSTATATLTATLRPTTLTLTLDPATVHVGSGSIATAIVIDGAAGASNPAGTVGFLSTGGGDTLSAPSCTLAPVPATTDRSSCQVTVTPGAAGPRTVTASYVGNGVHATSTAPATLTATLRPTTLTLTLDPATVQTGIGSIATAIVIDGSASGSNPAGTVGFVSTDSSDGLSAPSCTLAPVPATTDRSSCQVTVTPGTAAPRTVTASYVGNGVHAASTAPATLTATLRPTTLTLTLDPAIVQVGSGSVATAIVIDGAAGASNPAGTVGFLSTDDGDTLSAPACTLAPVPATTDRSSCQVTVTPGTGAPRTVTASYAGNGIHAASTASATLIATSRQLTYVLSEGATGRVPRHQHPDREPERVAGANRRRLHQGRWHDGHTEHDTAAHVAHDHPRPRHPRSRVCQLLDAGDDVGDAAAGDRADDDMGCNRLRSAYGEGELRTGIDVVLRRRIARLFPHLLPAGQPAAGGQRGARHVSARRWDDGAAHLPDAADVAAHTRCLGNARARQSLVWCNDHLRSTRDGGAGDVLRYPDAAFRWRLGVGRRHRSVDHVAPGGGRDRDVLQHLPADRQPRHHTDDGDGHLLARQWRHGDAHASARRAPASDAQRGARGPAAGQRLIRDGRRQPRTDHRRTVALLAGRGVARVTQQRGAARAAAELGPGRGPGGRADARADLHPRRERWQQRGGSHRYLPAHQRHDRGQVVHRRAEQPAQHRGDGRRQRGARTRRRGVRDHHPIDAADCRRTLRLPRRRRHDLGGGYERHRIAVAVAGQPDAAVRPDRHRAIRRPFPPEARAHRKELSVISRYAHRWRNTRGHHTPEPLVLGQRLYEASGRRRAVR